MRIGPSRRLSTPELMLSNCDAGKTFESPWIARRSNQSILKEIIPEYSLEGLMLKLKLQYFATWRLTGKHPDAGKDWRQKEKGVAKDEMVWEHHWLNGHEFEQTLGDSEGQGSLTCCSLWGCRVWHDLATEQYQIIKMIREGSFLD